MAQPCVIDRCGRKPGDKMLLEAMEAKRQRIQRLTAQKDVY